jgi:hypothetical protein
VKCWITNRTAGPLTFRIRQAFAGAGVGNEQYRAYDTVCPASDLIALPVFTMMASDTLNFTQSANGLTVIADALDVT